MEALGLIKEFSILLRYDAVGEVRYFVGMLLLLFCSMAPIGHSWSALGAPNLIRNALGLAVGLETEK